MARGVVAEMKYIKDSAEQFHLNPELNSFSERIGLRFSFESKRNFKKSSKIADSSEKKPKIFEYIDLFPIIDPLNRFKLEMEDFGLTPFTIYKHPKADDLIIVRVVTERGIIAYEVQLKRITSSSKYVFTLWMIFTAILTSFVAILFLNNQIRSIKQLSKTAEKFGKGNYDQNFRPTGSKEIRSLAISFIKMRERILRQMSERTDLLSMISHDLRTPLTRMKLQLEMMKADDDTEELSRDVGDMEKMVGEYLNFAHESEKEKSVATPIARFLSEQIIKYYIKMNKPIEQKIEVAEHLQISIRPSAFKRAIVNLIDNALRYGSRVVLAASVVERNFIITIDDDGPGIKKEERKKVFKSFYQTKVAIKKETFGLGLAITKDIIASHGGKITLLDSPLGGLRAMISIPV